AATSDVRVMRYRISTSICRQPWRRHRGPSRCDEGGQSRGQTRRKRLTTAFTDARRADGRNAPRGRRSLPSACRGQKSGSGQERPPLGPAVSAPVLARIGGSLLPATSEQTEVLARIPPSN